LSIEGREVVEAEVWVGEVVDVGKAVVGSWTCVGGMFVGSVCAVGRFSVAAICVTSLLPEFGKSAQDVSISDISNVPIQVINLFILFPFPRCSPFEFAIALCRKR
jgi:hypothetical protein